MEFLVKKFLKKVFVKNTLKPYKIKILLQKSKWQHWHITIKGCLVFDHWTEI